jgi:hypothetical protein
MGLRQQLARMVAAIVLIAAFAVPTLARAHEGHAHRVPGAAQVAPGDVQAAPKSSDMHARKPAAATVSATALSAARDSAVGATGVLTHCSGGYCCGGAASMACCGAALAPESFWIPLLQASAQLRIPRAPPLPGLPPEALPKPPKSIA